MNTGVHGENVLLDCSRSWPLERLF